MKIGRYEFSVARLFLAAVCYMLLIDFHELGHLLSAKLVGFHPESFKLGHGEPHLVLFSLDGIQFSVHAFLVGGGVQIRELMPDFVPSALNLAFNLKKITVLLMGGIFGLIAGQIIALFICSGSFAGRAISSIKLLRGMIWQIGKALWALFLFRHQKFDDDYAYFQFWEIPLKAAESNQLLLRILYSTAISDSIFNILPIPLLDGGKIAFAICSIAGLNFSAEEQTILVVLTGLPLIVLFAAAILRGFRWPIPK